MKNPESSAEVGTSTETGGAIQDLSEFRVPKDFRGQSLFVVQLWRCISVSLFACSPQYMYGWRRWLLRRFGAKIGDKVLIRPSVTVSFPWKLEIGDHAWVGDGAILYNLAPIRIGHDAVVSQGAHLCSGSHDYRRREFPLIAHPITVEPEAWIASEVFIGPGVEIGRGAIVGARSLVLKDIPALAVAYGTPARVVGKRAIRNDQGGSATELI